MNLGQAASLKVLSRSPRYKLNVDVFGSPAALTGRSAGGCLGFAACMVAVRRLARALEGRIPL